jgi:hypothetical protein
MMELAGRYESAEKIVLVMHNLSTHSCQILKEHMGEDVARKLSNRFEISARRNWVFKICGTALRSTRLLEWEASPNLGPIGSDGTPSRMCFLGVTQLSNGHCAGIH